MIIRFNLVPKYEREKKRKIEIDYVKLFFICILIVVFAIITSFVVLEYKLNRLERLKRLKIAERNTYKKIIPKIKQLKEQHKEITQKILTILSLKKKQGRVLYVYYIIASSIEKNDITFKNLTINSQKALLKGISLDLEDVANFLQTLESHKEILKTIELENVYKRKVGGIGIVEFNTQIFFKFLN